MHVRYAADVYVHCTPSLKHTRAFYLQYLRLQVLGILMIIPGVAVTIRVQKFMQVLIEKAASRKAKTPTTNKLVGFATCGMKKAASNNTILRETVRRIAKPSCSRAVAVASKRCSNAKINDLLPLLWPRSCAPMLRCTICCRCFGFEVVLFRHMCDMCRLVLRGDALLFVAVALLKVVPQF